MKSLRIAVLVAAWIGSLFGVGLLARQSVVQAGPPAQGRESAPVIEPGLPVDPVISGADLGFQRISGPANRDGSVTGKLVVRIDGKWRDVASPVKVIR